MTAAFAHEYEELHRLVDRLPVERVRALRAVAVYLVSNGPAVQATDDGADGEPRRRLTFTGIMDAEPDLATRAEEILREELGRPAA